MGIWSTQGALYWAQNSGNFNSKSNGMDHFGSVRVEYLGPPSEGGPQRWPALTGPLCPYPFDKIVAPSAALPQITKPAMAWVWYVQPDCTFVPFHWARGISEVLDRNFSWKEGAHSVYKHTKRFGELNSDLYTCGVSLKICYLDWR